MNDYQEGLLSDIQKNVDSIDSSLKDQFTSVDGVNYATKEAWMRLVDIKLAVTGIGSMVTVMALAALVTAGAVVSHVVHHW
jgi:hypothetical protein